MDSKATAFLGENIARMIKVYVGERVAVFQSKQDATIAVINNLRAEVAALEARVADAERRLGLKAVA